MPLIEQDEKNDFYAILRRHHFSDADFELQETDTTDPKSDEIYALQGYVTVLRKSTHVSREYPLGDGTAWVAGFQKDLEEGCFG